MLSFDQVVAGRPMVAKSAKSVDDAIASCSVAENKYDGMRLTICKDMNGNWDVLSRTLKSQRGKMPHIDEIAKNLPAGTILDGEAVLMSGGKTGKLTYRGEEIDFQFPDFHDTMRILGSGVEKAAKRQKELGVNVSVFVFDMPFYAGENICELTARERRARMEPVVKNINHENLVVSPLLDLTQDNIDRVFALGGEGLMAKNLDEGSEYVPGARTKSWLKLKFVTTADVVIMGLERGEGKFSEVTGAITYGQYKDGVLTERGRVGSGMTDELRMKMDSNPEAYIGRVMEIAYMGIGTEGFRHPRMKMMRSDKLATDCIWDNAEDVVTKSVASAPKRTQKARVSVARPAEKLAADFEVSTAKRASEIATCFVGTSSKYYQTLVSEVDGEFIAWARYGRWDRESNAPKTTTIARLGAFGADFATASVKADETLAKKRTKGYNTTA